MGAKHPTALEAEYSRKLRKVANVVGDMINHHTIIEKDKVTGQIKIVLHHGLQELLKKYSESITPFAERLAMDMINRVDKNMLNGGTQTLKNSRSNYKVIGLHQ